MQRWNSSGREWAKRLLQDKGVRGSFAAGWFAVPLMTAAGTLLWQDQPAAHFIRVFSCLLLLLITPVWLSAARKEQSSSYAAVFNGMVRIVSGWLLLCALLLVVNSLFERQAAGIILAGLLGLGVFCLFVAAAAALFLSINGSRSGAMLIWSIVTAAVIFPAVLPLQNSRLPGVLFPLLQLQRHFAGQLTLQSLWSPAVWITVAAALAALTGKKKRKRCPVRFAAAVTAGGVWLVLSLLPLAPVDLTVEQQHTLDPQTKQLLRSMQRPVKALLFSGKPPLGSSRVTVERYRKAAADLALWKKLFRMCRSVQPKFSFEEVRISLNPEAVQQYDITAPGTVQLISGKKRYKLEPDDYRPLLFDGKRLRRVPVHASLLYQTLQKIVRKEWVYICFTAGHGEINPNDEGVRGGSAFRKMLHREGYIVSKVKLFRKGTVPAGCDLLVIAAPEYPFTAEELQAVRSYLLKGGRVVLSVDSSSYRRHHRLLSLLGVEGRVLPAKGEPVKGAGWQAEYAGHPVTAALQQRELPLPVSRAVFWEKYRGERALQVTGQAELLRSAPGQSKEQAVRQGSSGQYPLALALRYKAAAGTGQSGRAVVIGATALLRNAVCSRFAAPGNFAVNAVNWLLQRPDAYLLKAVPMTVSLRQQSVLPAVIIYLVLTVLGAAGWNRCRRGK